MNSLRAVYEKDGIDWIDDYYFEFCGDVYFLDIDDRINSMRVIRTEDKKTSQNFPTWLAKDVFEDWNTSQDDATRYEFRKLYRDLINRGRKKYPKTDSDKGDWRRIINVRSKMTPEELSDLDRCPWFEQYWRMKKHPAYQEDIPEERK